MRSKFTHMANAVESNRVRIAIKDLYDPKNSTMSVTNDLERIFEEFVTPELEAINKEMNKTFTFNETELIYRDTEGLWNCARYINGKVEWVWADQAVVRP